VFHVVLLFFCCFSTAKLEKQGNLKFSPQKEKRLVLRISRKTSRFFYPKNE
jgi:hypothetical protein